MAKASKGGEFERQICKYLSKWIQGTEKPYIFWRGRGSGAMFTLDEDTGKDFSGDIYVVRREGLFFSDKFSLECKNGYPGNSVDYHLKYNKSDGIKEFWEQCCNDANASNRSPMLIYRKKGIRPIFACIDDYMYGILKKRLDGLRFIHLSYPDTELPDMYMFGLDEFFEKITPDTIEGIE